MSAGTGDFTVGEGLSNVGGNYGGVPGMKREIQMATRPHMLTGSA